MRIFTPQKRSRVALDVNSIQDPDLRQVLAKLAGLQEETNNVVNGLSPKVQIAEQEIQGILNQLKATDQNLTDVINNIKTQISALTSSAIRYVQMNEGGLAEEEPKFRKSFIYMVEDAVGKLEQVVSSLKGKNGLMVPGVVSETNNSAFSSPESNQSVQTDIAPEPASLITSSRKKVAVALREFVDSLKEIEPLLSQAGANLEKNNETMNEINEVMNAVSETMAPEPENTELFSPEGEAAEGDMAPPEEEVGEAADIEESGELEEPAAEEPAEEAEPAAEEETAEPAAEEETAEPAAEVEETVEEEATEEPAAEEEPAEPVEKAAPVETTEEEIIEE
jgi:hypothetical protein